MKRVLSQSVPQLLTKYLDLNGIILISDDPEVQPGAASADPLAGDATPVRGLRKVVQPRQEHEEVRELIPLIF